MDYEREQREAAETAEVAGWGDGCPGVAGCRCPDCLDADEDNDEDEEFFDQSDWDERMSAQIDSWDEVYA